MALAILDLMPSQNGRVRFSIDTGTSRYYRLELGKRVLRKSGIDWVDDVFYATPIATNSAAGRFLNSATDITIPSAKLPRGLVYAQLFSFKSKDGISPAFSHVLSLPVQNAGASDIPGDIGVPFSLVAGAMNAIESFVPARAVPCRTARQAFASQASLEDLLASIVKAAAPVVADLLRSVTGGGQPQAAVAAAGGPASGQADILVGLLRTILTAIPGLNVPELSRLQSLNVTADAGNRFGANGQFSRPFIFGIDDALLGALIGPVLQVLPQLVNAANQHRLQMKQADNKLVTDLLSDVNKRMLLTQLLQVQRGSTGQPAVNADLNELLKLLQQLPAANTATQSSLGFARSQSLGNIRTSSALSTSAVLSFVLADPIQWNEARKAAFARNRGLQFKIRLTVAGPAPRQPLTKSIFRFTFKDASDQSVHYEKTFKQKNVEANSVSTFAFSADELAHLPANRPLNVFAEMRWLNSQNGSEYKALGSAEIVLVGKYFVADPGSSAIAVRAGQELTDMNRFRPFWNKIWESPALDAASGSADERKQLWELDVYGKYTVLLSGSLEANGLMQTRLLRGEQDDPEGMTQRTNGRLKAGIELSLAEVNKLLSLWPGQAPLDQERLLAFASKPFEKRCAGEFVYRFKLRGRAGQRGMLFVVPVFRLFEFVLNTVVRIDDAGQVIAASEEKVTFPLPLAARVIGLTSQ